MAFISASFSNKKLQGRRYTYDEFSLTQEAFTSVLDINASEVLTDVRYVPSSSAQLPFSGSSDNLLIVSASHTDSSITPGSADDLPILKYWYRHKLKPGASTNREVFYFTESEPASTTDGIGNDQLIESDQLTNFATPKYINQNAPSSDPGQYTETTSPTTPGYRPLVYFDSAATAGSVNGGIGNRAADNSYVWDAKTGVLILTGSLSVNKYVYMTTYQYVGRTLNSQITDGTLGGTVDYGNDQTSAEFSSSIAQRATDLETASGSFSTRVTTNETDITNLQSDSGSFSTRVTTNETDITNLQSDSASFSTRVAANETDITNLQSDSASFSTRVSTLEDNVGQAVNTDSDVTFNSVTTTNDLDVGGDLTVDGNLTVNGDLTSVSTTNIDVKDAFIYLASGSTAANVDAGLFVQSGSADNSGSALYHDVGDQRWAVAKGMAQADTNLSANTNISRSYVVTTAAAAGAPDETDVKYGYGEIYINSTNGDIYIRTTQD